MFRFVLIALASCIVSAYSADKLGRVSVSSLNIRSGAGTNHPRVGSLSNGDEVKILGKTGEWYKIWPKSGMVGYVHASHLRGRVLNVNSNFKTEADGSSQTIGRLPKGAKLTILGKTGPWRKVRAFSNWGIPVYAHSAYINEIQAPARPKKASAPSSASGAPVDGIRSKACVLIYDVARGREIWSQNPNSLVPIASLTKMMTLLVALEEMAADRSVTLDTMVPISERAAAESPTKACLQAGKKIKLKELLSVMIVISCNDCATCAGEFFGGGSIDAFVKKMNAKARALGMKNTTFRNAHGLPGGSEELDNRGTARDMRILTQALLKHKQAREWVKQPTVPLTTGVAQPTTFNGHTPLLGKYGIDGVKTGYTRRAGSCVATHAKNSSGEYIIILLGFEGKVARNGTLEKIMIWLQNR